MTAICDLVALRVASDDPVALAGFWAAALDWSLAPPDGPGVALVPADGTRFTVRFEGPGVAKVAQNRLHLDLTTTSADDQQTRAARLRALGATVPDIGQTGDEPHLVLADPDGNELCLIEPENRFLADCRRLGAISCDGTRTVGVFWSAVLGWPLVWDQDEETAIRETDGTGPMITWGGPPIAPKRAPNRLRLEVVPASGWSRSAAVERLRALGATAPDGGDDLGPSVLLDPDGNELHLLDGPAG